MEDNKNSIVLDSDSVGWLQDNICNYIETVSNKDEKLEFANMIIGALDYIFSTARRE